MLCKLILMFNKVEGDKPINKKIVYLFFTVALLAVAGISVSLPGNSDTQSLQVSSNAQSPSFVRLSDVKIVKVEKREYSRNEQLSPEELRDILYGVGFRGNSLVQAWAVAMKESTGRPRSHNKNSATGDNSYGLFQINMIGSLGPVRLEKYGLESNKDLFDPVRNAKIAYQMSNGGRNWSAWAGMTDKTVYWMSKFPKKS